MADDLLSEIEQQVATCEAERLPYAAFKVADVRSLVSRVRGLEQPWQPIETAPKDGTRLLLWAPAWIGFPVGGEWDDKVAAWVTEAGVMEDGPANLEGHLDGPTHWKPLPAPPSPPVPGGQQHG